MKLEGGLKISNKFNKVSTPDNPLISIITVVYNSIDLIEFTIRNIVNQTYNNIEYIIIDGGSTDGTLDVIKKYDDKIAYWVSERDKGLYDAMNKSIDLATGDYVWFMNSGDLIYDDTTTADIFRQNTTADVLYGATRIVDIYNNLTSRRRLKAPKNLTWKTLRWGMLVCHQSFIPKKELVVKYDCNFRYAADIDWEINILKKAQTTFNTNLILSNFLDGGISGVNRKKSLKERYIIMKKHYGTCTTLFFHVLIFSKAFVLRIFGVK